MAQIKVYEMVTERILALLDKGTIPWRKPWSGGDAPMNLVSKRAYRGINVFLLGVQGYGSPYWVTFRQAKKLGGNVRKGEKSTVVVFWKPIEKTVPLTDEERDGLGLPEGAKAVKKVSRGVLLRYYRVFNVEQCDGLDKHIPEPEEREPLEPHAEADRIVDEMEGCPEITHGGGRAYYRPSTDAIGLPEFETFESTAAYCSTRFHEIVHATGHSSRLGRFDDKASAIFGSKSYSEEELVAEMGAAFLNAQAGIIEDRELENSAAYINGWREKLTDDPKLVVVAAARAQKAADWVLNKRPAAATKTTTKQAA